jgi:hypothetical protein
MSPEFSVESAAALRAWLREETFDSGRAGDETRFYRFAHAFSNDHRTLDDENELLTLLTKEVEALHARPDEVGLEKNIRKWIRAIQTIMAYRAALDEGPASPS